MTALTLDDLATIPPLKCEAVPVPEFGEGKVAWLAELTAHERDARIEVPFAAYKERVGQENNVDLKAFCVAACWCKSEARDFVADDAKAIEAAAIKISKLGTVFTRLMPKVEQLNGLSEAEVKQIEKN